MLADKVIKKVPGKPSTNQHDKTGFIESFNKLTDFEITEILERQNKLLADRVFVKKLPDKGQRIHAFKERLENELKKRNELSDVCEVMSGLTVNGKALSVNLEWGSKVNDNLGNSEQRSEDSDGEESNPFKIIATHSGAGFHEKIVREERAEEPLIKQSDLIADDVKEDGKGDLMSEPYVAPLCCKFDNAKPKERYLPFKTLVNEKKVNADKVRDVSSATPPVSKLANVKQVSLQESLLLQADQAKHLREVQLKHAADRLREKGTAIMGDGLPPLETTHHYRESPPSDSEEEILDEDAKEEQGGVTFPLANS